MQLFMLKRLQQESQLFLSFLQRFIFLFDFPLQISHQFFLLIKQLLQLLDPLGAFLLFISLLILELFNLIGQPQLFLLHVVQLAGKSLDFALELSGLAGYGIFFAMMLLECLG